MNQPHNLYFHVPFCVSKCHYCAFGSAANSNPDWDGYTKQIIIEIIDMATKVGKVSVPTIFFGGGTPSLMPEKHFEQIMIAVNKYFNVEKNCEITIESNPGTIDKNKLFEFKQIGMNRLSIGIQSFNDLELKFMGRCHNVNQSLQLLQDANNLGLRTSGDFIYGLPNQNISDVKQLCENINNSGLNHCSLYELTIEENTPFGKMNLDMPDNETMADMFNIITEQLNLPRYEVSNYGFDECQHNKNIWMGKPYIGFGKYAAGRVLIDNVWYEQMGDGELFKPMNNRDRDIEKIILGLRTKYGFTKTSDICDIIDENYLKNNSDLIKQTNDKIIATDKGLIILDDILVNLIK